MTVATCSYCGAPRDPRAPRCAYCGSHFIDSATGKPAVDVDDAVESALRERQVILAIKLYRDRHRVGLKEAKEAVEQLQKRLGL